jgi:hypothetical protein
VPAKKRTPFGVYLLTAAVGVGAIVAAFRLKAAGRLADEEPDMERVAAGLVASKAARAEDVDFQAVIEPESPAPPPGKSVRIDLGLRLTNRSRGRLLFGPHVHLPPVLHSADGKAFAAWGGRDHTIVPGILPLSPGENKTILIGGHLGWTRDGKSLYLAFEEGTGEVWSFEGLGPGKYRLRFPYESYREGAAFYEVRLRLAEGEFFWDGKALTEEVVFTIGPVSEAAAAEPRSLAMLITELESADARLRLNATTEIFRRGEAVLPGLEKAGAKLATPTNGDPDTRRLDMIYSLLRGLPAGDAKAPAEFDRDSLSVRFEVGTTEELALRYEWRDRLLFATGEQDRLKTTAPVCELIPCMGERLEDALRDLLCSNYRVVTVSLNRRTPPQRP